MGRGRVTVGLVLVGSALVPGCRGSSSNGAVPPASAGGPYPASGPGAPVAAAPAPAPGGPAPAAPGTGAVTVEQAGKLPAGSTAVVRGLFLGWRGPCQGQAPTRSAWMLADADRAGAPCLYVDGPPPAGTDPNAAGGPPVWVRVDGRVDASGTGPYVSARKVEREP